LRTATSTTVGGEIGIAQRRGHARIDLGVGTGEAVEPRRQPLGGEAGRRADHEDAFVARVTQAGHGIAQLDEARLQAGIELLARGRQRDRSHAPFEQLQAEQLFEPADLVAQGSRRHVQLERGLGQAEMPRGGLERAQGIERRHRLMHEISSIIR
jgi:hypothetical protein